MIEQSLIYTVPLFENAQIKRIEAYRSLDAAEEAVRSWVNFEALLKEAKVKKPDATEDQLLFHANILLDEGRYAGTMIYEADLQP